MAPIPIALATNDLGALAVNLRFASRGAAVASPGLRQRWPPVLLIDGAGHGDRFRRPRKRAALQGAPDPRVVSTYCGPSRKRSFKQG